MKRHDGHRLLQGSHHVQELLQAPEIPQRMESDDSRPLHCSSSIRRFFTCSFRFLLRAESSIYQAGSGLFSRMWPTKVSYIIVGLHVANLKVTKVMSCHTACSQTIFVAYFQCFHRVTKTSWIERYFIRMYPWSVSSTAHRLWS